MDRVQEAPKVVLPADCKNLFANRASRMDALAHVQDGPMGPYLGFLAHVCRAQSKVFNQADAEPVSPTLLQNSREHGMPPVADLVFNRAAQWRADLKSLLSSLAEEEKLEESLRAEAKAFAAHLESDPNQVESLADAILTGAVLENTDARRVPFVGAALQVYFTRIAQALPVADVQNADVQSLCPCCGSRPTASVVHMEPDRSNARYLYCSLCQTEWNMERVKCSSCYKEGGIAYLIIDTDPKAATKAAVRAETCDDCKTYLKIFIQEKDPLLDVMADDIGSLALDMLVDEKGYTRTGPNLLLYPGSE